MSVVKIDEPQEVQSPVTRNRPHDFYVLHADAAVVADQGVQVVDDDGRDSR